MEYTNLIPWGISAISLLFVILTFARNGRKDTVAEEHKFDDVKESLLKANMKLDQLCATTNETRTDIKSMNTRINDLDREVEVIKRDVKTAFNLIENLKEEIKR